MEVRRMDAQKENDDTDEWQDIASFWQDSAQMLNFILINYEHQVIKRDSEKQINLIAGFKVDLGTDKENNAALITTEDKETVWDKLPKILENSSLKIDDKDRSAMTYFINYEKEEPGFFASLFDEEQTVIELESGNYQVVLSELGELTAITFNDGEGQPLDAKTMVKLFPQLSQLFAYQQ